MHSGNELKKKPMKRFIHFLFFPAFIIWGQAAIAQPPVQTKLQNISGNSNPKKGKKNRPVQSISNTNDKTIAPPQIDRSGEKILGLPVRNEQNNQMDDPNSNLENRKDSIPNVSEVPVSKPPSPVIDNSKFPVHYSTEQSTTIVHQPQTNGQTAKFNKQPSKGIKKKAHRVAVKGKIGKPF